MVFITGAGWITPFAAGSIREVVDQLQKDNASMTDGYSRARVSDSMFSDSVFPNRELQRDRGAGLAAMAVGHAIRVAKLDVSSLDSSRVGIVLGAGLAGQVGMLDFAEDVREQSARFVSPIHFPQTVGNYVAGALARGFGACGPNLTVSRGSASGLEAVVEARGIILDDRADVVLCGGSEHLTESLVAGLTKSCQTPCEGACFFVLESADHATARQVKPMAMVCGVQNYMSSAMATDASHSVSNDSSHGLVSTAGYREKGAIFMEHWVGHCLGNGGATALAGAIAGAWGCEVPVVQEGSAESSHGDGWILKTSKFSEVCCAKVQAVDDGGMILGLDLQIESGERDE